MDSAKNQLADKLKTANNVLVTVSRDPSVDQLSALLGLTLLLNKLGKHAAAVFSGQVPSTIEFLQPEETIEKNTDSLRDFIIALDKSKADKLRYKVEDDVVRIFITPYKTSISQDDLEFSQGDFNVDIVVALGVRQQEDLDEAITAHGRILHDATVASINVSADGGLGSINWHDQQASSLSELVTDLAQLLGKDLLDNQIATALLTGIVAETDRFSNDKTSSTTMSASAALMTAGANQQLVATKLEEPETPPPPPDNGPSAGGEGKESSKTAENSSPNPDGTLQIEHNKADKPKSDAAKTPPETKEAPPDASLQLPEPRPAEPSGPPEPPEPATESSSDYGVSPGPRFVTEPPKLGGMLNANTEQENLDPVTDPLSLPTEEQGKLLNREEPAPAAASSPSASPIDSTNSVPSGPSANPPTPAADTGGLLSAPPSVAPAAPPPPDKDTGGQDRTLADLEQSVNSPHLDTTSLDAARDEVTRALSENAGSAPPEPIQALNAQPLGGDLHPPEPALPQAVNDIVGNPASPLSMSGSITPPSTDAPAQTPTVTDSTAPPPVPPPLPFQFGTPSTTSQQ